MSEQLKQAVEAFSQIRDAARAKDMGNIAFAEAIDYQISWDQFHEIVEIIYRWQRR